MKRKRERIVTAAAILAIIAGASVTKAELVAYWDFDDQSGNTAVDSVAGRSGRFFGNPVAVDGHLGGALEFDGIDDYIDCGGGKQTGAPKTWADIEGAITLAAWIKVEQFSRSFQAVITKGDGTWRLSRDRTTNSMMFGANRGGRLWRIRGTAPVNDGQWHHVAGIYDGSEAHLFIDGKLEGSVQNASNIMSDGWDVRIGTNAESPRRYWRGLIDEVVIFSHALSQDELRQLRELGGSSFLPKDLQALKKMVREANGALTEKNPKEAATIIEKKLAEAKQLTGGNRDGFAETHRIMVSKLHYMLARAKEASKASTSEISTAYADSASLSAKAPQYVSTLLWLLGNTRGTVYSKVIKESIRNTSDTEKVIGHITDGFEAKDNWTAFRLFLDAAVSELNDPSACAEAVAASLETNGVWANSFAQYCRDRAEFSPYLVKQGIELAETAAAEGDYLKAAEIYRDIIGRCPADQKMAYEMQLCEHLFQSGRCDKAIPEIEAFIEKYRIKNRSMIIQAILLRGRTYLQMNDMNRASDIFLDLMVDYPETSKAPEANFFIGYCSMLQGNLDEARETLEFVINDYPTSMYASKAKLCIRRIDKMAR
ncbi:MAG: tetratricopeptide repeat protein [Phycisphaerales bacterium]|nr:MAG: tetratricopeptide repeat protein [Phycisphaerales bacterium]